MNKIPNFKYLLTVLVVLYIYIYNIMSDLQILTIFQNDKPDFSDPSLFLTKKNV